MNIPALPVALSFCGIHKADWAESKHPRASNGQFGSGGSSAAKPKGKESAGAKHKRNQQARRAEGAGQSTLGGGKAIQTLLGGGSALDKIGWLNTSKPKQEAANAPDGKTSQNFQPDLKRGNTVEFTSFYADKPKGTKATIKRTYQVTSGPLKGTGYAVLSFGHNQSGQEIKQTVPHNVLRIGGEPKEPEKPAKAPTKPPEKKPEAKPKEPAKPTPAKIESAKDIIQGNLKSGKLKRETVIAAVMSLQAQANEAKSKGDHAASKDLNFQAAVMVDAAGIKSHELISSTGNATRKPATPARQNAPNRATDARNDPRNDPRAGDPLHDPLPRGYRVLSDEETKRQEEYNRREAEYKRRTGRDFDLTSGKQRSEEEFDREYKRRTGRDWSPNWD